MCFAAFVAASKATASAVATFADPSGCSAAAFQSDELDAFLAGRRRSASVVDQRRRSLMELTMSRDVIHIYDHSLACVVDVRLRGNTIDGYDTMSGTALSGFVDDDEVCLFESQGSRWRRYEFQPRHA